MDRTESNSPPITPSSSPGQLSVNRTSSNRTSSNRTSSNRTTSEAFDKYMKKRRKKTPNASKFNKAMASARGETIAELKQEIAELKDTLRVRDDDLERLENWTEYTDAKPTLCNKTINKSLKQRLKDKSEKAKLREAALKEEHDKLPYPFRAAENRGSFKKGKKGTKGKKGKKGKKGSKGKKKKGGGYTRKRSRRTRRTRRR